MTFVASPRIRGVGGIYADRCVYAPDAAYTHMCLYAVVGAYTRVCAYTRALGAYTQVGVRLRERWVHIRSGRAYTPGCVYAGRCVYASGGCVYAAYTHRRVRIRGSVRIRERWVLVRSGCVYTPGCVYAGRCVYASGRCVYAAGAYTRVGAFTRVVGACTQRVPIWFG